MKVSRLQRISSIAKSRDYLRNKNAILGFVRDRELKHYFLDKFPKKFQDLQEIGFLLEELVKDERPFALFKILEESISENNNPFIVGFLKTHYGQLGVIPREGLIEGLFQEESLAVAQKLLTRYPDSDDEVFHLVKKIFVLRGKEYRKLETKRDRAREKDLVSKLLAEIFSIYKEKKENEKIGDIITLIDEHFNLVGDDGQFVMYTPHSIFRIIRDYLQIDFEPNFKEMTSLLVSQYDREYKKFGGNYKGWELMGGAICQVGGQFSVRDRHFVSYALEPALERYYCGNKHRAWQFIMENCISRTKEEVSRSRPDFLNRAALSTLLREYDNGQHAQEAFQILSDFVRMRKGIPHKADLIFQELKASRIDDARKWELIEASLGPYKRLPVNVFVEQIATDLAGRGFREARDILQEWPSNPEYLRRQGLGQLDIIGNISRLLSKPSTIDDGIKLLKGYISSGAFKSELDRFDSFNVGRQIARAIQDKPNEGLSILSGIYKDPVLTINQQIALTSSLRDVENNRVDLLVKLCEEFLLPTLMDLEKNVARIEKKFTHRTARENIVEFAGKLAKAKKFDYALEIVKIFINDSDPSTPARPDPEDHKGDFDYHRKIVNGEDPNTITTVRGHACWVLHEFGVLDGRSYIPEVVKLVDQLHGDPNYYVRQQVCFPLLQLMRVRHTVLPDNRSKRFLPKKIAGQIEQIAFDMLEDKENQKLMAVMKSLARVFSHIRSLDEKRALTVVTTFKSSAFEEVLSEFAPTLIFFAEFRKGAFRGPQWEYLGEYDDSKFKRLLEDLLRRGSSQVRSSFGWQFCKLTKEAIPNKANVENVVKYGSMFTISKRYLSILAESYEPRTFSHIYQFIQDNILKRFEDCYALWRKCLQKEKGVLDKSVKEGKAPEVYWLPFHDNGKILVTVKGMDKFKEFLNAFEYLLGYPKEISIGEISDAVEALEGLSTKYGSQVDKIFGKLAIRNPVFHDAREKRKKRILR